MAALHHDLGGMVLADVEDKFRQRIDPRAIEKPEHPQIQRQRRGLGISSGGEHLQDRRIFLRTPEPKGALADHRRCGGIVADLIVIVDDVHRSIPSSQRQYVSDATLLRWTGGPWWSR